MCCALGNYFFFFFFFYIMIVSSFFNWSGWFARSVRLKNQSIDFISLRFFLCLSFLFSFCIYLFNTINSIFKILRLKVCFARVCFDLSASLPDCLSVCLSYLSVELWMPGKYCHSMCIWSVRVAKRVHGRIGRGAEEMEAGRGWLR